MDITKEFQKQGKIQYNHTANDLEAFGLTTEDGKKIEKDFDTLKAVWKEKEYFTKAIEEMFPNLEYEEFAFAVMLANVMASQITSAKGLIDDLKKDFSQADYIR